MPRNKRPMGFHFRPGAEFIALWRKAAAIEGERSLTAFIVRLLNGASRKIIEADQRRRKREGPAQDSAA